jgi:hypothetical protein
MYQPSDLFPKRDPGKFREWEFRANPQPMTFLITTTPLMTHQPQSLMFHTTTTTHR